MTVLAYDNPHNPLLTPHYIVQTCLRPDIIIYSNATKQVFILELTVPAEDNIIQRHTDKERKCAKLLNDINTNQWPGHVFGIEIGGVVVACLLHTQEVPGSIPGRGSYLRQVSLH